MTDGEYERQPSQTKTRQLACYINLSQPPRDDTARHAVLRAYQAAPAPLLPLGAAASFCLTASRCPTGLDNSVLLSKNKEQRNHSNDWLVWGPG
jgi:hypothetical protein